MPFSAAQLSYKRFGRGVVKLPTDAPPGTKQLEIDDAMREALLDGIVLEDKPSLIAHMLVSKYRFGVPFHRLALMLRAQNVRIDDGTMCRYAEDVGTTLGCVVDAIATNTKETAFFLFPTLRAGAPCREASRRPPQREIDEARLVKSLEHLALAALRISSRRTEVLATIIERFTIYQCRS